MYEMGYEKTPTGKTIEDTPGALTISGGARCLVRLLIALTKFSYVENALVEYVLFLGVQQHKDL